WARNPLRYLAALGIACFALVDTACSKRKDGVVVEVSEELAQSGAAVRDWRRSGTGVLDVQVFTEIPIPGNAWTLAAYDKEGKLLTSGRISGPRARQRLDPLGHALPRPVRQGGSRGRRRGPFRALLPLVVVTSGPGRSRLRVICYDACTDDPLSARAFEAMAAPILELHDLRKCYG